MDKDKPKKAALLLGLALKPKGKMGKLDEDLEDDDGDEDLEDDGDDKDHDAAFNEAADKILEAVEAGDKEGFREALQAAIYACQE